MGTGGVDCGRLCKVLRNVMGIGDKECDRVGTSSKLYGRLGTGGKECGKLNTGGKECN